ncbi:TPA: hypothetical protein ACGO3Z_001399, partial [Streptococcus suis]
RKKLKELVNRKGSRVNMTLEPFSIYFVIRRLRFFLNSWILNQTRAGDKKKNKSIRKGLEPMSEFSAF